MCVYADNKENCKMLELVSSICNCLNQSPSNNCAEILV